MSLFQRIFFLVLFLNLLSHLAVKSMVPPGDVESSVPEWDLTIVGMMFLMPKSVLQFRVMDDSGQQQLGQLSLRYLKDSLTNEGRYQ